MEWDHRCLAAAGRMGGFDLVQLRVALLAVPPADLERSPSECRGGQGIAGLLAECLAACRLATTPATQERQRPDAVRPELLVGSLAYLAALTMEQLA